MVVSFMTTSRTCMQKKGSSMRRRKCRRDHIAGAALTGLCMSQWISMGSCFLMANTEEGILMLLKVIYNIR